MKGFKNSTKMSADWGPAEMAKGGPVDRSMIESTSARPVTVPLSREVPTAAERGAIQRGNRAAVMEAGESALLSPSVRRGASRTPLVGRK